MRQGASLGQRGWHGCGLQLHADAHEDARALSTFDFFRSTVPTDGTAIYPPNPPDIHLIGRSEVIAGAAVSGAKEELTVGFNDGGGHNFESY